jgi:NAD(P)-dependent dehydrogenase (short-subunit alcohol dehydrogenase family)
MKSLSLNKEIVMGRLESKIAIITGATSGIGEASARLFAREGAKVAVVGRNKDRGERIAAEIRAAGGEAVFIQADVSKELQCRQMIEQTVDSYGRLDILFNNAGTTSTIAIEDADEAEFDRVMGTNLKSVFFACKYAIPIMKRQKYGVILTCTSKGAIIPTKCSAIYAASKAGANQLTQAIAINYGRYGIRANELLPSYVQTPMTDEFIERSGISREQIVAECKAGTALDRIATSEECAYAALFLVSDEASYVTGTPMLVDGGAIFS